MRRGDPPRRPVRWRVAAVVAAAVAAAGSLSACVGTAETDVAVTAPPSTASSVVTTTTIDPLVDCAAGLGAEAQAAQLLMALVADPGEAGDLVGGGQVGSYALQGEQSPAVGAQVASTDARAPGPFPVLAASDEEGGTVQRLREVLGSEPAAADVAADLDPGDASARAEDYSRRMGELGFDMVLAPVLDVGGGSGLGSRSFSDDPSVVTDYGLAVAEGIRRAGLVPVAKHWPGLGRGETDPHDAPTALPAIDALRSSDLVPFEAAIAGGIESVMVSHATVAGLTGDVPASRSRDAITGELRGRQGYDGLVVTDSLGMEAALAGATQEEAAEAAIAAGADLAMVAGVEAAVAAHARLVDAITTGRLDRAQVARSVARVLATKGVDARSCQPA